jgi:hypothetical protein
MQVIKVNNECQTINMSGINMRGLTSGQAALYKYLEKCNKEKVSVELIKVAEIYFNIVRRANGFYHSEWDRKQAWLNMEGRTEYRDLLNKDALIYFSRPENHGSYCYAITQPVKSWMKVNVGSLVMRGLLNIIPAFDTELTKIDDGKL